MKAIWKFRLCALTAVVAIGAAAISNLASEILRPAAAPLPSRNSKAQAPQLVSAAKLASRIAPFRTDLKADYAIAAAGQTLKSEHADGVADDEAALSAVKRALDAGPADSRMWFVLALLQTQKNTSDPAIAESLKLSYLTGPNRADLILPRLDAVTMHGALNDSDLSELARSDVRAVLTQYPDQKQALIDDYVRASAVGKAFLETSIKMLDPAFANTLAKAK